MYIGLVRWIFRKRTDGFCLVDFRDLGLFEFSPCIVVHNIGGRALSFILTFETIAKKSY